MHPETPVPSPAPHSCFDREIERSEGLGHHGTSLSFLYIKWLRQEGTGGVFIGRDPWEDQKGGR